jgi:hypothetical protein
MKKDDIIYIEEEVYGIPSGYYRFIGGEHYLLEPLFRDSLHFSFPTYKDHKDNYRIVSEEEIKLLSIK